LDYADQVLLLSEGGIKYEGTYKQMLRLGLIDEASFRTSAQGESSSQADLSNKSDSAEAVAKANEISDLKRKTGDFKIYSYYFRTFGWTKALTFIVLVILQVFANSFGCKLALF
jgi:ATP-binding cassette, subfamily C (CFTR/MRP), member 1